MEELKEISEFAARKVSVESLRNFSKVRNEFQGKEKKEAVPKDHYHLVYLVFFLYGIGSFLPMPFLVTANDYWMYKFRNTSLETVDNHHRTALQANFLSISSMTHSIPGFIANILTARYGHNLQIRTRCLAALAVVSTTFLVFTAFAKINTDSWQIGFFVMTISVSTTVTVTSILFQVTQMVLISRFPPKYIKAQMYGQSTASLLSSIIQIIALSIGHSSTTVALIYFSCGTFLLMVTLFSAYMTKYIRYFNYYAGDTQEDSQKLIRDWEILKNVLNKIWPIVAILLSFICSMGMTHPNITSLVVSENYGYGHMWNDKYFVPVITFLVYDIFSLIGRYLARPIMTVKNSRWITVFYLLFIFGTSPLYLFCNALPRKHLPVLFEHDWEYITIHAISSCMRTYMITVATMAMPTLAEGQERVGFLVLMTVAGIVGSAVSPLGTVYVNLL